jgi:hypothetical protein
MNWSNGPTAALGVLIAHCIFVDASFDDHLAQALSPSLADRTANRNAEWNPKFCPSLIAFIEPCAKRWRFWHFCKLAVLFFVLSPAVADLQAGW